MRATLRSVRVALVGLAVGLAVSVLLAQQPTPVTVIPSAAISGDGATTAPALAFTTQPTLGFYRPTTDEIAIGPTGASFVLKYNTTTGVLVGNNGLVTVGSAGSIGISASTEQSAQDVKLLRAAAGIWTTTSVLFANLGTPAAGSWTYCSDCLAASIPCTGASTGAFAFRQAAAWSCK